MTHWAAHYIGDPWILGEHDCWGFFRRVQQEQFGRLVPIIDIDATDIMAVARAIQGDDERDHWREIDRPADGDAVLLARTRYPSHVGVWADIDGGGVLHCEQGSGVIFTPEHRLGVCGWSGVTYYRYEGRT